MAGTVTPGWLLRFQDSSLETEYEELFKANCMPRDVGISIFNILIAWGAIQKSKGHATDTYIFATTSLFLTIIMVYLIWKKPLFYKKHRSIIIILTRTTRMLPYLPALMSLEEVLAMEQALVFKTALLAFFTLGFRLPFKQTVPTTTMMLLANSIVDMKQCNFRCKEPELAARHLQSASKYEKLAGMFFPYGAEWSPLEPLSPAAACWVVSMFVQIMLGYTLPLMIAAAEEENSRLEFLALAEAGPPLVPSLFAAIVHSLGVFLLLSPVVFQALMMVAAWGT